MRENARFICLAAASAALTLGAVAATNAVIDPFRMTRAAPIAGWNVVKPAVAEQLRIFKAYDVRHVEPDVLTLGTSRGLATLRMSHPGWMKGTGYNASIDGASMREMFLFLRHAHAIRRLKQVVLGADAWLLVDPHSNVAPGFDADSLLRDGGTLSWLRAFGADARLLTSLDTLKASLQTVRMQHAGGYDWLMPDGKRDAAFYEPAMANPREHFLMYERKQVGWGSVRGDRRDAAGAPMDPPHAPADVAAYPSVQAVVDIIELCRANDIDLRIYISPQHAVISELDDVIATREMAMGAKRYLVSYLAEDAKRHPDRPAIPLWDFSPYSSVTTEAVPPEGSLARLRGFWDPSHGNDLVGDWILDRIFSTSAAREPLPADFGVALTPANVEETIERDRLAAVRYQRESPDALRIRLLAAEAMHVAPPLRVLARDLLIGAAAPAPAEAEPVLHTVARELDLVTIEDALGWDIVHPAPGTYAFAAADRQVDFAAGNGMAVHGTLLPARLPPWAPEGAWTAETLGAVLDEHIDRLVGRYRGRVGIWTVVGDARADGGLPWPWASVLGPDYVERAFRRARAADPDAVLLYGHDASMRSDAARSLLKELLARGVPVDGIAFRSDPGGPAPDPGDAARELRRFAELGLGIYVASAELVDACLGEPACKAVELGSPRDGASYRSLGQRLLTRLGTRHAP